MNLYLIERPDKADWDEYVSAIVCAATPEEAQHTHPSGHGESVICPTWVKPEVVKVTFLGIAHESIKAGVICASLKAG